MAITEHDLGPVRGDINDSVATFEQAGSRENIKSGDAGKKIFGKIQKWFADMTLSAFATIVNNATTTAANTVLDGRMGKTLMDLIDQLNRNLEMSAMIVDADTSAEYPTASMYVNSKTLTAFPVLAICGSALHWISFDLSKATGTLSTTGIVNTPLAGSTGYLTAVAMAQGETTTRLKFTTNGSYLRLVVPRKEYFSNIVHSAS